MLRLLFTFTMYYCTMKCLAIIIYMYRLAWLSFEGTVRNFLIQTITHDSFFSHPHQMVVIHNFSPVFADCYDFVVHFSWLLLRMFHFLAVKAHQLFIIRFHIYILFPRFKCFSLPGQPPVPVLQRWKWLKIYPHEHLRFLHVPLCAGFQAGCRRPFRPQ